jgi:hypothetical protein
MSYFNVFGGDPIFPAKMSRRAIALSSNITLLWAAEGSSQAIADIIDVTPSGPGLSITLPDARKASPGVATLVANLGADTVSIRDAGGAEVAAVDPGSSWQIYLRTNTTLAGTWGAIQAGAFPSGASAAALAGMGTRAISNTLNTAIETQAFSTDYTTGPSDRAKALTWTGGSGTLTLPSASTLTDNWYAHAKNAGSGTLTISPASGQIDGAVSLALSPNDSCTLVHDGTDFFTIGRGRTVTSTFDFIAINAAGTGTLTLSSAQQNKVSYRFTGTLTGNRDVIVPASVQQYWVDNATSGAFTLTVKTAAGTGVEVVQGQQAILYCDGTNVVRATSAGVSLPLAISDGGTGATSAGAARTSLGATSIGGTIFTAADAGAVRTALTLVPGTDIQGYSAQLASVAALGTNGIIARTASNTVTARTITGTSNRLTVTNGDGVSGAPTLDIASDYAGQNTIVTLGTVTTGTWSASTIAVDRGGTGVTSPGSSGNVLTSDGTAWVSTAPTSVPVFPSGTKMLFAQTSAPTGWTKDTTHNDKTLRVVSGTAGSGGSVAFTTAFSSQNVGATTLTTSQIPSHTHTFGTTTSNQNSSGGGTDFNNGPQSTTDTTNATGGGGSHTHTLDIAVQYVDVIIATKD